MLTETQWKMRLLQKKSIFQEELVKVVGSWSPCWSHRQLWLMEKQKGDPENFISSHSTTKFFVVLYSRCTIIKYVYLGFALCSQHRASKTFGIFWVMEVSFLTPITSPSWQWVYAVKVIHVGPTESLNKGLAKHRRGVKLSGLPPNICGEERSSRLHLIIWPIIWSIPM